MGNSGQQVVAAALKAARVAMPSAADRTAHALRGQTFATVTLSGLTTSVQIGDGFTQRVEQTGAVTGDCWIESGRVLRVRAPDGIEFANSAVSVKLAYDSDITDLCDLAAVARQIVADLSERDELAVAAQCA